jgi:hypothetical protein
MILIGSYVLQSGWRHYLRLRASETPVPLGNVIGLSAICVLFIIVGVHDFFR